LICRSIENFTASALSGVPSWNLMPLLSLKVYWQPVLRDRPGFGEAGNDLGALVGEGDERLDHTPAHAISS